jgi:RHS repeat-associated protein
MTLSAIASATADHPNPYLYNAKELQDDHNLNWYDYGARYYSPSLARWTTPDPLAKLIYNYTPYNYVRNNPIRRLDPNGMNDDDFFFTQKGELVAYVENDEPDRVFIANNDEEVYNNLNNAIDESMYKQVDKSKKEIEHLMQINGYKKVVKEAESVEINKKLYLPSEMGGLSPVILNVNVDHQIMPISFKYVDKYDIQTGYTVSNVEEKIKLSTKEMSIETTVYSTRTYKYGNKINLLKTRASKTGYELGSFVSKTIPWNELAKIFLKH